MKLVLQRVTEASVTVDDVIIGQIGHGLLVLVCMQETDTAEDITYFARKVANMRIFQDEAGKMNRSVGDVGGSLLVVSQFTLAAEWRQGNRPGFTKAAKPDVAIPLLADFIAALKSHDLPVETGKFGADMKVRLLNDGPITLVMDSDQ